MEDTLFCPGCGTANPARRPVCKQCGRLLHQEARAEEEQAAPPFSLSALPNAVVSNPPQSFTYVRPARFQERPQVKIVRSTFNRRKFLVSLLGGAMVVGFGGATVAQTVQILHMALNTKQFPLESYRNLFPLCYSSDLNLMALTSTTDDVHDPRATLSIWDYQQQSMTTLVAGPTYYLAAWSPDNRYLLRQTRNADDSGGLDLWDIHAGQRISGYNDANYDVSSTSGMSWSPDGMRIALLTNDKLIVLSAAQLQPVFELDISSDATALTWSPDNKKLALLIEQATGAWKLQIWDVQTQQVDTEVSFQGQQTNSGGMLRWSPDGVCIAALTSRRLCILQAQRNLSSFVLDKPDYYGNLAWSPDSHYLAVSSSKGPAPEFSVWDIAEQIKARVLMHDGDSGPDELAWSKDGRFIVSILGLHKQVSWPWP